MHRALLVGIQRLRPRHESWQDGLPSVGSQVLTEIFVGPNRCPSDKNSVHRLTTLRCRDRKLFEGESIQTPVPDLTRIVGNDANVRQNYGDLLELVSILAESLYFRLQCR